MRAMIRLPLSAAMLLACGCMTPSARLTVSRAELAQEKAALIRQYRECLQRAETDRNVDCSGYRTAVEINDTRDSD